MTPCRTPNLQAALLEAAQSGDLPDRELVAHLEDCEDCKGAIERVRRMVMTWIAEQENEDESAIVEAASRFATRMTQRREAEWRGPLPFALAGAALAAGVLLVTHRSRAPQDPAASAHAPEVGAAAAGPAAAPPMRGGAEPTPSDRDRSAALRVPHVEGPGGFTPLVDGLRVELKTGESATVSLADGKSSVLRGPCAVEFWSSSTEVGGWRLSPAAPTTSGVILEDTAPETPGGSERATRGGVAPSNDPAPPAAGNTNERGATGAVPSKAAAQAAAMPLAPPSPKAERAWARAAEALRRDDFDGADSSFADLCSAPDAATRDAARLARAQLWIAHGRGDAVRPVLRDLAAHGATALVRQRAAEFLSVTNP